MSRPEPPELEDVPEELHDLPDLEDWVVVYTGSNDGAQALAARLEQHGYRSFVTTRPGSDATRRGARSWVHETLVPPGSESAVRERIALWEMGHAEASARLGRTLARVAILSALPPAAWYGLATAGAVPGPPPGRTALVALYAATAVVLAQLAHRRTRERIALPDG